MGKQKTVLLVDDEQIMHDLASAYLEREGFTLQSAYTGSSGLEMIKNLNPDIVLLDYMLPQMNGEQVFEKLRQDQAYSDVRDTPVILLTARGSDEILKTRLLKQGIVAYLQKPFGLRELSEVINNIITLRDIRHSNRLLEFEVKSTKQHLSSILQNAPVGIFSCDDQGNLVDVNQYLLKLLPDLSVNHQFINVLEDDHFKESFFGSGVRSVLETGASWKRNLVPCKCGHMHDLILNMHFVPIQVDNEDGDETVRVMGIIEDVTEGERKNFQLRLLSHVTTAMQQTIELKTLLHLLLTAITAGPALGFTRAMIFLVNDLFTELTGAMGVGPISYDDALQTWNRLNRQNLDMEEYIFKHGLALPVDDEALNLAVQSCSIPLDANTRLTNELRENKPFWYKKHDFHEMNYLAFPSTLQPLLLDEFIAMPVVANGKLLGAIIADNKFNDQPIREDRVQLLSLIAAQAAHGIEKANSYEQLRAEKLKLEVAVKKLRQAQVRLIHTERLAAIGEMAAHVAHEIRNPLVTIGGFARQIEQKIDLNIGDVNPARVIADEVLRLEKILENVLNFTKLPEPTTDENNINALIHEVIGQMEPELREKGISLDVHLHENSPDLQFDWGQLKQVLLNLLNNSQQSFVDGGTIRISTQLENEIIQIRVEDNGPGIAPDLLTDIFNPFYTTKKHGTGLGLAISQRIVHGHGGDIRVKTNLGHGTQFDVLLPINYKPGKKDNGHSIIDAVIV